MVSAGSDGKKAKNLVKSTEGRTYIKRRRLVKTRDVAGFPLVIARRDHPRNNLRKEKKTERVRAEVD